MIDIELLEGPLDAVPLHIEDIGALIEFHGIVRSQENGERITGLDYQVYEPMTHQELSHLATRVWEAIPVASVIIRHSFGFVPVGSRSFYLAVGSRHRQAGLLFVDRFISEMKATVPIWKVPVYARPAQS